MRPSLICHSMCGPGQDSDLIFGSINHLISYSSLKLVCNLKYLSCKQFHEIVKGDFTCLGNLRNLPNIHGLKRLSKDFVLCILNETLSTLSVLLQCLKLINRPVCYLTC